MLQNAYFLAKIGADTAENEQHFAEILPRTGNYPTARPRAGRRPHQPVVHRPVDPVHAHLPEAARERNLGWVRVRKIGKISKFLQIFGGLVLGCIKTNFCKKICV